jgi:hypothetical protein
MYILDKTRARKVLLDQNIKPHQADRLLEHLSPVPDRLGHFIDQWLQDQTVPDVEIDGITLKQVMDNHHSHFLIAICDLAMLLDPDLTTEKRTQWRRILSTQRKYE